MFLLDLLVAFSRQQVDSDKLAEEVRKEVEKQILSGLVQAVGEYNQVLSWGYTESKAQTARNKINRHIEYVQELFAANQAIIGVLGTGIQADEIEA